MSSLRIATGMLLLMAGTAPATAPPLPSLHTVTAASGDGPIPIPDNNPSGILASLTIPDVSGVIADVDVALDITHASPGQLRLELISPSGTIVTLSTNNGGSNADALAGVLFDDQAPPPTAGAPAPNVRNFPYAPQVAIGAVQPEEPLGALLGEPVGGAYGLASTWFLLVRDDAGGTAGTLRSWSLTLSTAAVLRADAPVHAQYDAGGTGTAIPDNDAVGIVTPLVVSGAGPYLHSVEATVDIAHPTSGDLELLLSDPAGTTIELVTRFGGGNDDLYAGTTFSDAAGTPISDTTLPPSGTPLTRVTGEGALSAFVGGNPNGQWLLTVRDRAGGATGRLRSFALDVRGSSPCGDGVPDPGESCDDGNATDGDGCDSNCTPTGCGNGIVTAGEDCDDGNTVDGDTCPAACREPEVVCDDCVDNDSDGFTDAADPGCAGERLQLTRARVTRQRLSVIGFIPVIAPPSGPIAIVLADATGTRLCAAIGTIGADPRSRRVRTVLGEGMLTVALMGAHGDKLVITGRRLTLPGMAGPITVGVDIAGRRFSGSGSLRARGVRTSRP